MRVLLSKKTPTRSVDGAMSLFYDAFAFVMVFCLVIEHTFFTGVGVTINTKMATGVVHPDVLAYHAAAYLALTSILDLTCLLGDRWQLSEHVTF